MNTQLTIKTLDGAEHRIRTHHTEYTLHTVAELVEQELHCAPSHYRLIPAPTSRDTFILVPLRHKETKGAEHSVHKGPSSEAIAQATSHFASAQSSTNVQPAVIQELEGQIRGLLTRLSGPAEPAEQVLNADSVARLQEMGFTHAQVTAALTQANGNELLAAQYLLGDTDSDLEGELEEGAPDEPLHALHLDAQQVITTLFSNPNFLQGVNDPSVLAALQHILAEPSALEEYLNDPQIGPLLLLLYNSLQQQ